MVFSQHIMSPDKGPNPGAADSDAPQMPRRVMRISPEGQAVVKRILGRDVTIPPEVTDALQELLVIPGDSIIQPAEDMSPTLADRTEDQLV